MATMTAAVMRSAAVTTAGVSFFTMFVVVVIASDLGIEIQFICKQSVYCIVARAANSAEKLNARTRKCHLSTTANSAANENISTHCLQKARKCAVTASIRVDDLGRNDLSILYCVDLKLLRVTEMLKDLSVFVSNCNFHIFILLIINYISQLPSQFENSI